jgi:hypothetical protein
MNDTVIIFSGFSFVCRAELWADILNVLYSAWNIKMLIWKFVCSQHFTKADFYFLNIYAWTECWFLFYVQHPLIHISYENLQNSLSLFLLWVYHLHLLPVQITFLSRNQLKAIPCGPQWHAKYFQIWRPPFPCVLMKMLVAENLLISTFRVLLCGAEQGILY